MKEKFEEKLKVYKKFYMNNISKKKIKMRETKEIDIISQKKKWKN
jgi:hypothetical protein